MPDLLIVSVDGYGKRVPVADVRLSRRDAKGVRVSSVPVAAALIVRGGEHVMVATASGRLERVAVDDVPVRRRRVLKGGGLARGARLVRLDAGDRVTTATLTSSQV